MLRLAWRTIVSHKRRLVSTVLSIVLGVAFLVGTFVFTDSLGRSFDDLFASVYANTDAVARPPMSVTTPSDVLRLQSPKNFTKNRTVQNT